LDPDALISVPPSQSKRILRPTVAQDAVGLLYRLMRLPALMWRLRRAAGSRASGAGDSVTLGGTLFRAMAPRTILLPIVSDPMLAVRAWTGPTGAPKDFQFTSCSIEVKSNTSPLEQKFTVSNSTQLHLTGTTPLYVFHLLLEEIRGHGKTLGGRVNSLRDALKDHHSHAAFKRQLRKARYRDAHHLSHDVRSYSYRSHAFCVTDVFPCFQQKDIKADGRARPGCELAAAKSTDRSVSTHPGCRRLHGEPLEAKNDPSCKPPYLRGCLDARITFRHVDFQLHARSRACTHPCFPVRPNLVA